MWWKMVWSTWIAFFEGFPSTAAFHIDLCAAKQEARRTIRPGWAKWPVIWLKGEWATQKRHQYL